MKRVGYIVDAFVERLDAGREVSRLQREREGTRIVSLPLTEREAELLYTFLGRDDRGTLATLRRRLGAILGNG